MPSDADDPRLLIDHFVDAFYVNVLADPLLSPLFVDVAKIDLPRHLPRIKAYWRKMLLGDDSYHRHMMAKHRALNAQHPLTQAHYDRWLALFEKTLDQCPPGAHTERARGLARRVAGNMRRNLGRFPA